MTIPADLDDKAIGVIAFGLVASAYLASDITPEMFAAWAKAVWEFVHDD